MATKGAQSIENTCTASNNVVDVSSGGTNLSTYISASEALRNAPYKLKTYFLTYLPILPSIYMLYIVYIYIYIYIYVS